MTGQFVCKSTIDNTCHCPVRDLRQINDEKSAVSSELVLVLSPVLRSQSPVRGRQRPGQSVPGWQQCDSVNPAGLCPQASNIMTPQQRQQQQQQQQQQPHTNRTLRNVTKRCSCEPLGMICETDPLMRPSRPDPSSVSGSAVAVTTLVTRAGDNTVTRVPALPESRVPAQGMKKVCSCEPGGPLCWCGQDLRLFSKLSLQLWKSPQAWSYDKLRLEHPP